MRKISIATSSVTWLVIVSTCARYCDEMCNMRRQITYQDISLHILEASPGGSYHLAFEKGLYHCKRLSRCTSLMASLIMPSCACSAYRDRMINIAKSIFHWNKGCTFQSRKSRQEYPNNGQVSLKMTLKFTGKADYVFLILQQRAEQIRIDIEQCWVNRTIYTLI